MDTLAYFGSCLLAIGIVVAACAIFDARFWRWLARRTPRGARSLPPNAEPPIAPRPQRASVTPDPLRPLPPILDLEQPASRRLGWNPAYMGQEIRCAWAAFETWKGAEQITATMPAGAAKDRAMDECDRLLEQAEAYLIALSCSLFRYADDGPGAAAAWADQLVSARITARANGHAAARAAQADHPSRGHHLELVTG